MRRSLILQSQFTLFTVSLLVKAVTFNASSILLRSAVAICLATSLSTALVASALSFIERGVSQIMSTLAMGLPFLLGSYRIATQNIIQFSDLFQVARVTTFATAT